MATTTLLSYSKKMTIINIPRWQVNFQFIFQDYYGNEQEEITGSVINETETKKWTKYLDEADDRGDNSDDSETVEDEMYTTDQKKYDSYHKQARRCKKRYINSLPLIKSPILQ